MKADHLGSAVRKVQRADTLDLGAHPDTVAAQHALVRIAHQRGRRGVQRLVELAFLETDVVNSEPAGQFLQLAARGTGAGGTFLIVVCQQQFDDHLAHRADFTGVGLYDHIGFRQRGTGGNQPAPLDFHHAQPAGAVNADVGMVTEGRDVDPRLADDFQQVTLVLDDDGDPVAGQGFFLFGHKDCSRGIFPRGSGTWPALCNALSGRSF